MEVINPDFGQVHKKCREIYMFFLAHNLPVDNSDLKDIDIRRVPIRQLFINIHTFWQKRQKIHRIDLRD